MTWPQPLAPTGSPHPPTCLFCGGAVPAGCGLCPHCGSSLGSAAATWTLQDPNREQYSPPLATRPSFPTGPGALFGTPGTPANALYQDYATAYSANRPNLRLRVTIAVGTVFVVAVVAIAAIASGTSGSSASDDSDGTFHSGRAHFSAQFPQTPTTQVVTETVDSTKITINLAVDESTHTEVAEISAPAGLLDDSADILQSEAKGVTVTTDWTLNDSESTTFEGSPALQSDYTATDGSQFTGMVFVYKSERVYVLLAPTGDAFNALSSSFTITG